MNCTSKYDMAVITGPTATGKTSLAAMLAYTIDGEIISADSRQVYRNMTIGTGKDLADFIVNGTEIPYHLIDIHDAGYHYSVFEFQKDFNKAFQDIRQRNHFPILCGGTGLYIEAALKRYRLIETPINDNLRNELADKDISVLIQMLIELRPLHNSTDISDRQRLIRAIEIEKYSIDNPELIVPLENIEACIFAIHFDRETIRKRITQRLELRIEQGMIDEIKHLLSIGVPPSHLEYYGLEYRYLTQYVTGILSYPEMFRQLNTAIHQFAKRQMTWFRKMQKDGTIIHWIDGNLDIKEKVNYILYTMNSSNIAGIND